jgi:hypothetical protein
MPVSSMPPSRPLRNRPIGGDRDSAAGGDRDSAAKARARTQIFHQSNHQPLTPQQKHSPDSLPAVDLPETRSGVTLGGPRASGGPAPALSLRRSRESPLVGRRPKQIARTASGNQLGPEPEHDPVCTRLPTGDSARSPCAEAGYDHRDRPGRQCAVAARRSSPRSRLVTLVPAPGFSRGWRSGV